MRVLVAPDKFAGTLTAAEAASAIAAGWRRSAPGDRIALVPMSDGGPGFVEILHAALGGAMLEVRVTGPRGEPVTAEMLIVGGTAYVESAQACGLHLVPAGRRDPGAVTTYGVGELIGAAVDAGARRLVVGLGGSATNDGGAGMLAALGARPAEILRRGGTALGEWLRDPSRSVDLSAARTRLADAELVAASDVDSPLLGPRGASHVFAPQKGATPDQVLLLEAALARWAERTDAAASATPGAGAAGGLGFGLMLLGAVRRSGVGSVAEAVRLTEAVTASDLVITGEGRLDISSLHGKVTSGVAAIARSGAKPCLVLAGQNGLEPEQARAAGFAATYAVADGASSLAAALDRPAPALADLAARVAAIWPR